MNATLEDLKTEKQRKSMHMALGVHLIDIIRKKYLNEMSLFADSKWNHVVLVYLIWC